MQFFGPGFTALRNVQVYLIAFKIRAQALSPIGKICTKYQYDPTSTDV